MNKISNSINLASNWLLNSGIQNMDKSKKVCGSFNSWFDLESNRFSFAYSEITGYGINTLLYLASIEKRSNNIFIKRARYAADYLLNTAYDEKRGGILCRFDHNLKKFSNRICTFDNAMCLNAIVNLFKANQDKKYLNFSIKIADWLLSMQKKDGSFYTRYLVDKEILEENGDRWSSQSGCFHAKVSIGLLNLFFLTNQSKYRNATIKICNWALKFQTTEGRFITQKHDKSTFLHPCCYTAEGLLVAAITLNERKYLKAVIKLIEWILKNKLETGGFPAFFLNGRFKNLESPEIDAQVLRLMMVLINTGEVDYNSQLLITSIDNILKYQSKINKKQALGGFYSGDAWFYLETKQAGEHVNSWVTMLILQTLYMYDRGFDKKEIFNLV